MELTTIIKNLGADVVYQDIETIRRIEKEMMQNPEFKTAIENGEHELSELYYKLQDQYKDVDLKDIGTRKELRSLERTIALTDSVMREDAKNTFIDAIKEQLKENGVDERDIKDNAHKIEEYAEKLTQFHYGVEELDHADMDRLTELFKDLDRLDPEFEPATIVEKGEQYLLRNREGIDRGFPNLTAIDQIIERGQYYVESFIADLNKLTDRAREETEVDSMDTPEMPAPNHDLSDDLIRRMERAEKTLNEAKEALEENKTGDKELVTKMHGALTFSRDELEELRREKERTRKKKTREDRERDRDDDEMELSRF